MTSNPQDRLLLPGFSLFPRGRLSVMDQQLTYDSPKIFRLAVDELN